MGVSRMGSLEPSGVALRAQAALGMPHWRVSSRPFCPSTHVLTPPYNGAPREVARDNILDIVYIL